MSKWKKLDNEFSEVLESMSTEKWHTWQTNRERNKALRLEQQKLAAELHLKQLELKKQIQTVSEEEFIYWKDLKLEDIVQSIDVVENAGNNHAYAMAA